MKPDLLKIRVDDNLGTSRRCRRSVAGTIDRAQGRKLTLAAHIYYLADAKALAQAGARLHRPQRARPAGGRRVRQRDEERNVCYSPTLMREVSTFVYDRRRRGPTIRSSAASRAGHRGRAHGSRPGRRKFEASPRPSRASKYKAGARGREGATSSAVRRRRPHCHGHRHRPAGSLPGLLRAPGARDDGRGRPDADAGARVGDRRRRRVLGQAGQVGTIAPGAAADLLVLRPTPSRTSATRGASTRCTSAAAASICRADRGAGPPGSRRRTTSYFAVSAHVAQHPARSHSAAGTG